jgi:hypothetical protein
MDYQYNEITGRFLNKLMKFEFYGSYDDDLGMHCSSTFYFDEQNENISMC